MFIFFLLNWPATGISFPDSLKLYIFLLLFSNSCFASSTLTLKTTMDNYKILFKFYLNKELLSAGILTYFITFQLTVKTDTLFPNPLVTIKSISYQIVKQNCDWNYPITHQFVSARKGVGSSVHLNIWSFVLSKPIVIMIHYSNTNFMK